MAIGSVTSVFKHASHGSPTTDVDYTTKLKSFDMTNEKEMVEATTFGTSSHSYEVGLADAEISLTYKYDDAFYIIISDIYDNGTKITFERSPAGTASGKPKLSGSCFVQNIGEPDGIGEEQTFNVTMKVSGGVTFGTH